jgi:hypothetical protein
VRAVLHDDREGLLQLLHELLLITEDDLYGWLTSIASLVEMGTECRQGAVGSVINREYFEIGFPLQGD